MYPPWEGLAYLHMQQCDHTILTATKAIELVDGPASII